MSESKKYDQRILNWVDGYVQGAPVRRQFIDRAAVITASSAAAIAPHTAETDYAARVYPGTNHGFHSRTTPRYDEAVAGLCRWPRIEFFGRNLV